MRSFCPHAHSFARSSCGAAKRSNKVSPRAAPTVGVAENHQELAPRGDTAISCYSAELYYHDWHAHGH